MQSRIGLGVCAAALLLVELAAAADPSLSSRLGTRIARPIRIGPASQARYRIKQYQPLLSEPYANCHAVALHVSADTLEVIHRWEHSGEYDRAAVPWRDIVENRVSYSLSSMYGGARSRQTPPILEEAKCAPERVPPPASPASPAALPARCRRLSSAATLVGQGGLLQWVAAQRGIVWTLELPRGHELIDFAAHEGLLFIATRSNQGARDGELLLPHHTTHVFAVPAPSSR